MSTISSYGLSANIWHSATVRQFIWALIFALLALAFGGTLYIIETFVFDADRRFIESPAAVMMRACGLAHFWIGWLFLFTSPHVRNRKSLLRLSAFSLLGIGLCIVCQNAGSLSNPIIFLFFYSYFLEHDLRDQMKLYQANERPNLDSRDFLSQARLAVLSCLIALLALGYYTYVSVSRNEELQSFLPPSFYWSTIAAAFLISGWLTARAWQSGVKEHGSITNAIKAHAPLMTVYAGIFAILFFGGLFGGVSFNLIILIHAGTWLVYSYNQLRRRESPQKNSNVWTWLRQTPAGFLTLHLTLIIVILAIMAMRVHLWERSGFFCKLFENASFPYWSLMHISMSFWRIR